MATLHSCTPAAVATAAFFLLLGACGGGERDGPDTSQAEQKFLDSVNLSADGRARFAAFKETARKVEGEGDFVTCEVSFEGEIEFTGPCYYHMKERQQGDRLQFDATIEYAKEASGWRQLISGLHPR